MSAVTLIELTPRRAADGVTQTIRLCHNARERANFLGRQWRPTAARLPTFESSIGFDGSNFGRGSIPVVGDLEIALEEATIAWAGLVWKGAGVILRRAAWTPAGGDPADGDFQTIWQGRVDSAAVSGATMRVIMLDPGDQLRRPMVTRQFGSSGVAVLDAAPAAPQRGNLVPMGWGRLEGVPAILIDPADLIYLLVGQAANGVQGFYDGGAAFTTGVSRASLAALRATSPAAGAVDYCLNADGLTLARPWTKPVYPFTADLTVGDARPAEVAVALVSSRTSIGFRSGAVAAYNAVQGADIGLYVADQASVADCLDRIFAPLGSFWKLRADGTMDLRRIEYAATPMRTFGAWQRERPSRQAVIMPTRRRTLGYKPNWRQHSESEIARALLLTAGEISYADGTPVEALKPSEASATNTAPANANRLRYTEFEGGKGWANSGDAVGAIFPFVASAGVVSINTLVTFTADGQRSYLSSSPPVPVGAGTRWSVSTFIDAFAVSGPPPGAWQIYLGFQNAAGAELATTLLGGGVGNAPSATRFETFADKPTGAMTMNLVVFAEADGAGVVQLAIRQPMLADAVQGQSLHPRYVKGLNSDDGATAGAPAGTNVAGVSAATLVANAATALADSASALSSLAAIANDAVLDAGEKPEVRQKRTQIENEYPIIRDRADALSVSRTALTTAYSDLMSYLDTLALGTSSNTAITRSTFNGRFTDYYFARQAVQDGIVAAAAAAGSGVSGLAQVSTVGASGTIQVRLAAGQAVPVNGFVRADLTSGTGAVAMAIEFRAGSSGSWSTAASNTSGAEPAPAQVEASPSGTLTNTGGEAQVFQVRANVSFTGSAAGNIFSAVSFVQVG